LQYFVCNVLATIFYGAPRDCNILGNDFRRLS
jgi:hypothetical protein